jgi:hypothetical protein
MVQTVVPPGSEVTGWNWLPTGSEVLASDVTPVPASRDQPIGSPDAAPSAADQLHVDPDSPPDGADGEETQTEIAETERPAETELDTLIYGCSTPYPVECVSFRGAREQNGTGIATFLLCPFRWDPPSRTFT